MNSVFSLTSLRRRGGQLGAHTEVASLDANSKGVGCQYLKERTCALEAFASLGANSEVASVIE